MDLAKLRMQITKTSLQETIKQTLKEIGIRGFYVGWTAAILRQLTYSTARLGCYTTLYDLAQTYFGRLNYATMLGIGMISGTVGAFVGTPSDLILVRMVGDLQLPPEKRRNYRNAFTGLVTIYKTEGIGRLWRGAIPTMTRGALVNGTQLGTYSRAKVSLLDTGLFQEGLWLQFIASMISGTVMCLASLPVDVVKTKVQNWTLPTTPPSLPRMLVITMKEEGIFALYRGWFPYYIRSAPYAVITMICLEQFKYAYNMFLVKDD
ncbi:mitochondrial 2-oxoglutarate/malate carrier protein-like [Apis mellifera caucasica]|uniref:Mitochondrial 2-oxoglutarate/malate carrier protein-like n=1 Tax=Apis mellifera TaxID=7460 RepID=A0A7M7MTR5_APIME|nr:mitochondrial 2-oxoglutarate/malate carrier protein-like [Apis mellifera]KAG6797923.1 mitochondrial 2-oxoglutarate/malate carrier protein-like [Apis mellifera caucasica]KAG9429695.1 mitochondrial 2-oxoglutarate/malate carrier protein-like [Apis mellifera carnica]|eukprot:XP_026300871.1 mitochondrial 2-oxoglutarate/malate carrier protein-like [Apis mellifera]